MLFETPPFHITCWKCHFSATPILIFELFCILGPVNTESCFLIAINSYPFKFYQIIIRIGHDVHLTAVTLPYGLSHHNNAHVIVNLKDTRSPETHWLFWNGGAVWPLDMYYSTFSCLQAEPTAKESITCGAYAIWQPCFLELPSP